MGDVVTINVSNETKRAIEAVARQEGTAPNSVINEALKQYLFVREFSLLRDRLVPKAQAQGIHTDEDVFERVS